ncbi:hypothetical protein D3C81_2040860 [compost metagenome]
MYARRGDGDVLGPVKCSVRASWTVMPPGSSGSGTAWSRANSPQHSSGCRVLSPPGERCSSTSHLFEPGMNCMQPFSVVAGCSASQMLSSL